MSQKTLWIITVINRDGTQDERLVNEHKRGDALSAIATVKRANPFDVARILAAGGKIEDCEGEPT